MNNADIKECKQIVHEDYVDFDENAEWFESYYQSSDYKDFMSEPPEDDRIDIDEFIESQMEEEASVNDFLNYYYTLHQEEYKTALWCWNTRERHKGQ